LLEVLIALIIAGAALAVLFHAGGGALTATRTATRYAEAVARARSHLAAALHGEALAPRDTTGDDGGGFQWRMRIAPLAATSTESDGAPITLYEVSVWIGWRDGTERDVRLVTQQVGAGAR
jgi:general secretion pathway protein I